MGKLKRSKIAKTTDSDQNLPQIGKLIEETGEDILNKLDQFIQDSAKGLEKLLGEPPSKRKEKR